VIYRKHLSLQQTGIDKTPSAMNGHRWTDNFFFFFFKIQNHRQELWTISRNLTWVFLLIRPTPHGHPQGIEEQELAKKKTTTAKAPKNK
jgi:hypothetical protein